MHSVDYVKSIAKVKHNYSLRNTLLIVGLLCAMLWIIYIMLSESNNEHKNKLIMDDQAAYVKPHYQLKLRNQLNTSPVKTTTATINAKALLMREHAPTQVYKSTRLQFPTTNAIKVDSKQSAETSSNYAYQINHPNYTVLSGEFIHANLETAINSDLPGFVRAITSRPVYAYLRHKLLIPIGSRLLGQYNSMVQHGINRVFIIWHRIILPSGLAVNLDSPAVDTLGQTGVNADSYNSHFFSRFAMSGLLSVLNAGVSNVGVGSDAQYNSAASYRMAIGQSMQQESQQSLHNSVQQKPTLLINQGTAINVFVAHDLNFYQVLNGGLHA